MKIEIDGQEIEFPTEYVRALQSLADRNGLTIERMLQQAITNEQIIEDKIDAGDELLIGSGNNFRKFELA